jgi:Catalytic LigB subunit of aromatic ring-opening dioxygenase
MATLVGGIGTPHTPMLGIDPSGWRDHGNREQESLAKKNLVPTPRSPAELEGELELDVMRERYARMQSGIEQLAGALRELHPDVLVIVGDDQRELFLDDVMPAVTVFWGSTLWDRPPGAQVYPPSMADAYQWYHADAEESYETSSALGLHLVEQLMGASFDVAQFSDQAPSRSLGHAFLWVYRRLLQGDRSIPFTPVILNTYYPPNQPTPARCLELGRALGAAIRAWPSDARVALVASGGLSHPIINEDFDQQVLAALAKHDGAALGSLRLDLLTEGSSEIRNWITVGGALENADFDVVDYVPAYRSMAGSGCGTAFAVWRNP